MAKRIAGYAAQIVGEVQLDSSELILSKPNLRFGQLSADATFTLSAGGVTGAVTIKRDDTILLTSIDQLVMVINQALQTAGLRGQVSASTRDSRIVLSTVAHGSSANIQLSSANNVTTGELGFSNMTQAQSGDRRLSEPCSSTPSTT